MSQKMELFRKHREALMERLPDGLILLSGGKELLRNHDVNYVFRQSSHFLYLTGVQEPGCHLLLDPKRKVGTLFIPRIDSHHRVWEGHVPGPAESKVLFGFSRVAYSDDLPRQLKQAKKGYRRAYAEKPAWKHLRKNLHGLKVAPAQLEDALEELRAVKNPGEIELMAEANRISGSAHRKAMASARAGMHEYEIQALFEYECLRAGFRHLAYPSIVAAGANSAVLHYRRNDAPLRDGQLLLIDAGAESLGYAADITRTFPIGKRFTQRQKDVYSIVLETQKICIDATRVGAISGDLHILSMTKIAEGLKSLGLLKGEVSGLVEGGAVRLFYPHGLTHMLGLDIHDVTGGRKRRLPPNKRIPVRFMARIEPGFAITMEPGIYFIESLLRDPALRQKYRASVDFEKAESFLDFGGVRIEDDVIVSPLGPPLNLTNVPKEIADVEECRAAALS